MFQNHHHNNRNNTEISHSHSKTDHHHPTLPSSQKHSPYTPHLLHAKEHKRSPAPLYPSTFSTPIASVIAQGHRFSCPLQVVLNAAVSETFSKDHTLQTTLSSLSASPLLFLEHIPPSNTTLAKRGAPPS